MARAQRCGCVAAWLLLNASVVLPLFARLNMASLRWRRCGALPADVAGQNATRLEVIVASPGHSGTTSLQVALEALGLRTYKTRELQYYLLNSLHPESDLAAQLGLCGVQAVIPDPYLEAIPKLVASSPGVKVILLRREWRAWASAAGRALAGMRTDAAFRRAAAVLCHWLPYGPFWPVPQKGHSFVTQGPTSIFLKQCILDRMLASGVTERFLAYRTANTDRIYGGMLRSEALYQGHLEHVRGLVPPDRLLELDLRTQGWAELAAFLGRPPPPSAVPFPRTRVGSVAIDPVLFQLFPGSYILFWTIMAASVATNGLAFLFLARACRSVAARAWNLGKSKMP